jgi:hypothetical protein
VRELWPHEQLADFSTEWVVSAHEVGSKNPPFDRARGLRPEADPRNAGEGWKLDIRERGGNHGARHAAP